MAVHTFAPSAQVKGQWHFTPQALKDLDAIIEEAFKWMQKERKRQISLKVKQAIYHYETQGYFKDRPQDDCDALRKKARKDEIKNFDSYGNERRVLITCKSGKKITCNSFSDALVNRDITGEKPTEFEVVLSAGKMKVRVEYGQFFSHYVKANVTPEESSELGIVVTKVGQWAEGYRLPLWQRIWATVARFHWFAWFLLSWLSVSVFANAEVSSGKAALKKEAQQLFSDGIKTDSDRQRALELVLASVFDLRQNAGASVPPAFTTLLYIIAFGFVVCIPIWFAPQTAIGIGLGNRSIERQKNWIFIVKWLGGFIVLGVGASLCASILYDLGTQ